MSDSWNSNFNLWTVSRRCQTQDFTKIAIVLEKGGKMYNRYYLWIVWIWFQGQESIRNGKMKGLDWVTTVCCGWQYDRWHCDYIPGSLDIMFFWWVEIYWDHLYYWNHIKSGDSLEVSEIHLFNNRIDIGGTYMSDSGLKLSKPRIKYVNLSWFGN